MTEIVHIQSQISGSHRIIIGMASADPPSHMGIHEIVTDTNLATSQVVFSVQIHSIAGLSGTSAGGQVPMALQVFADQATQIPGIDCVIVDRENLTNHFDITTFGDALSITNRKRLYHLEYTTIFALPQMTFEFHVRSLRSLKDRSIVAGEHYFAFWRQNVNAG